MVYRSAKIYQLMNRIVCDNWKILGKMKMYEGVNLGSKAWWVVYLPSYLLVRKIILVFILLSQSQRHNLQVFVVIFSSFVSLALALKTRSYTNERDSRSQFYNELAVAWIAYHLLYFTDFVQSRMA